MALRLSVASGRDRERIDATARAVIECAADAVIAFGVDRTVTLWNPAAERLFGWKASEVVGLELAFIPEGLQAENHAVLEHVASGGQVSFATRRTRKDGALLDLRIDTSALVSSRRLAAIRSSTAGSSSCAFMSATTSPRRRTTRARSAM